MPRTPILLSLGLAAALVLGPVPAARAQEDGPPPTPVTVIEAQPTDYTVTARLPGRIKASTVSEVRPQVAGIIRERLFEEGTVIEAGQPLYQIESDTYAAAVAAAQAAVAQAQANYDLAIREAERAQELFESNTGSGQRLDSAVAARDAADAALQLAKAQLQSAEIDLDRTTIRAAISGVIGFSQVSTGALVAAQQANPLATIRALDPVHVDVTQSANDLLRWQQTQHATTPEHRQATLILPTGEHYPLRGELRAAEPQVEPTTGMITLRISFPNPQHLLLPGLYVEVILPQAEEKDVYLVPQSAVMRDTQGTPHAWVVENDTVAVRTLEVLTSDGSNWVVTAGLEPGDRIITSGFQKTGPGAPITVIPGQQPTPAAGAAPDAAPADAASDAAPDAAAEAGAEAGDAVNAEAPEAGADAGDAADAADTAAPQGN
ncbi:membrane fusion protein, multidrug efflux system [Paracoccus solventivorans]|uniref:Membrane fusion protein, multidrug efflux system n=1 Tax=Paracoccus solventivorans TaxID=53463 RepID=A0A1M7EWD1_9RHOB|nr:efflux RND transporter periplasmic adaptor subunit [Paracoccus solventivorans]SHL95946.1 membrane fusion protein, multidrug efflux system [Paracoccus solventivorans]